MSLESRLARLEAAADDTTLSQQALLVTWRIRSLEVLRYLKGKAKRPRHFTPAKEGKARERCSNNVALAMLATLPLDTRPDGQGPTLETTVSVLLSLKQCDAQTNDKHIENILPI